MLGIYYNQRASYFFVVRGALGSGFNYKEKQTGENEHVQKERTNKSLLFQE
jgi:hypothetical protein